MLRCFYGGDTGLLGSLWPLALRIPIADRGTSLSGAKQFERGETLFAKPFKGLLRALLGARFSAIKKKRISSKSIKNTIFEYIRPSRSLQNRISQKMNLSKVNLDQPRPKIFNVYIFCSFFYPQKLNILNYLEN